MSHAQVIRCAKCGALNRVPDEKLAQGLKPRLGRCKRRLTGIKPASVNDATFQQVERSPLPALLDIWAPWCGPCRDISPVVDQLATDLAGRVFVGKLNADENPAITARFNIQASRHCWCSMEEKRLIELSVYRVPLRN